MQEQTLIGQINALERDNERLRAALKPFADALSQAEETSPENTQSIVGLLGAPHPLRVSASAERS